MNDFSKLAKAYEKSLEKPDKKYSILPTILGLAKPAERKIVSDLGCGSGFFTEALYEAGAKRVYGIDNSRAQLEKVVRQEGVTYLLQDAFLDSIPHSDIISAPFLINYAQNIAHLKKLLTNIYSSLNNDGKLIGLIDVPDNSNDSAILKKRKLWGATKRILQINTGRLGFPLIEITLFDKLTEICRLHSYLIQHSLLEETLRYAGFKKVVWHQPTISQDGIKRFGKSFWSDYQKYCELAYFTAVKN